MENAVLLDSFIRLYIGCKKFIYIYQGMFETYIAFDYRTLPPFVKIMHFYCGLKYLGKGLSRGVGVNFLRPFFFKKSAVFP